MEPPRDADGMDPELAAALGIQISDERTQEANVLGARLATGVSAPPLDSGGIIPKLWVVRRETVWCGACSRRALILLSLWAAAEQFGRKRCRWRRLLTRPGRVTMKVMRRAVSESGGE